MNLLISIDEEIYRHAQNVSEDSNDEWNAMRAIANGTPIPDNATVCDIDAIRQEIADLKPYAMYTDGMVKKSEILQIIDRHMKGDSE